MRTVIIRRYGSIPGQGTFGKLVTDGFQCVTVEREWLGNQHNVSSIPLGQYDASVVDVSALHIGKAVNMGKLYLLSGTGERTGIYIHPANYQEQLEGCISLGDSFGVVNGKWAVLNSFATVSRFMEHMEGEELLLIVERGI